MNRKELLDLTGEKGFKKAPELKLDQIRLQGSKGEFMLIGLSGEKDENGKYLKTSLGTDPLEVVFLKHRRVLFQFKKDGQSLMTNEHNHKDEYVMLFGPNEKGLASVLREKYQGLRTHQIVYCYVPKLKRIVRLQIKGSSLGSQVEKEGVVKYYDYLGSFEHDESSSEYKTLINTVVEEGAQGNYYSMSFVKGEKLTDEQFEKVADAIQMVSDHCKSTDEYYSDKAPKDILKDRQPNEPVVEYPTDEEVNPDDIPF